MILQLFAPHRSATRVVAFVLLAAVCVGYAAAQHGHHGGTSRQQCNTYWVHPQMHECRCWNTVQNDATIYDSCERAVTGLDTVGSVKTYRCDEVLEPGTCANGGVGCGDVYNCFPVPCAQLLPGTTCVETDKGACGMTFGDCVNPVNP